MKHYDDPMTELAALAFLCRAVWEGRPEFAYPRVLLSHRFGNRVKIYGISGWVAYYQVLRHPSGSEYVRLLFETFVEKPLHSVQKG